jgi:peptidoglycan/LPS O-acetylase OafA/YrhL
VQRVEWANSLRGVAAGLVIVAHYFLNFYVGQATISSLSRHPPLWTGVEGTPAPLLFLAQSPVVFGPLGVCLFFLLSGFVISISLSRYTRGGFVVGRLLRVLPTYAVGFLCTCAVIWASGDPAHELTLRSVVTGMIPGLSEVLLRPAPQDGIVWTLIVELVFYAVCVTGYRALGRRWWAVAIVMASCVLLQLALTPVPPGTAFAGIRDVLLLACPFIPLMLIGTVVASRTRGEMSTRATVILVPVLAVVNGTLLWFSPTQHQPWPVTLSYGVGIVVFLLLARFAQKWRGNRVMDFGARISFPIYVVHPILGFALLWVLTKAGVWWPVSLLIAIATAVLVAWLIHIAVEQPTHRLGQRWARALRARAARSGSAPAVGSSVS